jgi:hypothetical protein
MDIIFIYLIKKLLQKGYPPRPIIDDNLTLN